MKKTMTVIVLLMLLIIISLYLNMGIFASESLGQKESFTIEIPSNEKPNLTGGSGSADETNSTNGDDSAGKTNSTNGNDSTDKTNSTNGDDSTDKTNSTNGDDSTDKTNSTNGDDPAGQVIPVADLDIADIQESMIVGTSQMVEATVIPINASDKDITYSSQTPKIASVNALGRITALAPGKAIIQISAAGITRSISIKIEGKATEIASLVTDIDVDYEDTMVVGGTQVLYPRVLPEDATSRISYSSNNTKVATVNDFGKVVAKASGTATIILSADGKEKKILISVKKEIIPVDIDFDVPETKIVLGSSVLIGATVLPTDAIDQTINYTSSDVSVLTVNKLGRVNALSLGTANITLQAGNVKKSVAFTVVKEEVVTAIAVSDFQKKMKLDDVQTISASLYPTSAKDQKITYSTNDVNVVSISENGIVNAVGKGTATITLAAGDATKELNVTVYVPTKKIELSSSYLIMQPTNKYDIVASVTPSEADQNLQFRSSDETIATVTTNGAITALSPGKVSIILSNYDSMKAITVIVNEGYVVLHNDSTYKENTGEAHKQGDRLVRLIQEIQADDSIAVSGTECSLITTDVLRTLYQTGKSLSVFYDDYVTRISGKNIKNAENSLMTDLSLATTNAGISFVVNEKKNLPGSIDIDFIGLDSEYSYLYLLNDRTKKYERLDSLNGTTAEISLAGQYILSASKLDDKPFVKYLIIAAVLMGVSAVLYIVIWKKYWFW